MAAKATNMRRYAFGGVLMALSSTVSGASQTSFLNQDKLLTNLEAPDWYKDNIPFIEVPDNQIQEIYYFRWQGWKQHLQYTTPFYGYVSLEFHGWPGYSAPYGAISAAAGHHLNEGKWLRDQQYNTNAINWWLAGPGTSPKEHSDDYVNENTYDWSHEYSFWAADAVWQNYLINGDKDFIVGHLDSLVRQYEGWRNQFNETFGLYWQVPVWDATENSPSGYAVDVPYHGGAGYRPTLNSFQYGDAQAIVKVANLAGNSDVASKYTDTANDLKSNMEKWLWDDDLKFYMHRYRDYDQKLFNVREYMGFIPFMFNMPDIEDAVIYDSLLDPQGFAGSKGIYTAQKANDEWFMINNGSCCQWNGPTWPYATAQMLTGIENLLYNYDSQNHITPENYFKLIKDYAAQHYQDGVPSYHQAHWPDDDNWEFTDGPGGDDEDYNHSTFVDNVMSGLFGIRGQPDDSLVIKPLAIPSSWDYFAVENFPYHGHLVTVIWDKDGSRYNQGKGLSVYVDGKVATTSDSLQTTTVKVGASVAAESNGRVNIAINAANVATGPSTFASYTSSFDAASHIIDGLIHRPLAPNVRWTSYQTTNPSDFVGIDLKNLNFIDEVHLYFYSDSDGVPPPSSWKLEYCNNQDASNLGCSNDDDRWVEIPSQKVSSTATTGNDPKKITFPGVTASQLRVSAPNPGSGKGWGLSEFEIWAPPIFKIQNKNSGLVVGVDGESTSSGANVKQAYDNGSKDHLWQLQMVSGGYYQLKNLNSGLLLGVQGGQNKTAGAFLQQVAAGSGDDSQLWSIVTPTRNVDGYHWIQNKFSGMVAAVNNASKDPGEQVTQYDSGVDSGDHYWYFIPAVPESS